MRVSVVVCTYNRIDALQVTLDALRYQGFTEFEVIVVNGPSTDHTADMLREWEGRVKVFDNPAPNLSISRNIGIRAAAGDLVAFIDDDAIPEFDWLADIVPVFDASDVGGVGGLVFDHTGLAFQYRFSASSRLGEPLLSDTHPFDDLCLPGAFRFPYLQGTNAVFRREVLDEIGGFDETYDYYLDETDVCARIVDAGLRLRQLDDAHVHHKFLPSAMRNEKRVYTRWYPVIKNLTYFGFRHALDEVGEEAILAKSRAESELRVSDALMHEHKGRLPEGTADQIRVECEAAIEEGARLGRAAGPGRLPPMKLTDQPFLPFPVREHDASGRTIVLVSAAYGESVNGGIAQFITDLAPHLVEAGHEVRVVTRSPALSSVDFEHGIWVHRVDPVFGGALPGTSESIDNFASVAGFEIDRMSRWRPIDLVYGPAWDMEILPVIRNTGLPVVALLATPVAVTNHLDESLVYRPDPYARLLLDLEQEIFDTADLLHADSEAVVAEIGRRYARPLDAARLGVALLGCEPCDAVIGDSPADRDDGALTVLFVGRIEQRKGIDTLLAAIERLVVLRPGLRFVLAGAENLGEGAIRQPWLDRHAGAPWLAQVEFLGHVAPAHLSRLYLEADIAVVPSLFESFGLTVVEAMRYGVPVVASAVGAIPELVREGVEALLVPARDPDALAGALASLADDAAARARIGAAGRVRYQDQFTMAAATARLDALLARVQQLPLPTQSMAAGHACALPRRCAGPTRLTVRAHAPARLRIGGETLSVEPGIHRIPLGDDGGAERTIEVLDGAVELVSLIHVALAT